MPYRHAAQPTTGDAAVIVELKQRTEVAQLRGCHVYFMDAPTRDFFLSRTERATRAGRLQAAEQAPEYESDPR